MHNIIKHLKLNNVEFIRFFFPNILGEACDFSIPTNDFKNIIQTGKGFDGSSIHGMARIDESDLVAMPDLTTLRIFPWEYECKTINKRWREAVIFCDILLPNGRNYEGDTRFVLKRVLNAAQQHIDNFFIGSELEFFLFKADVDGNPLIINREPVLVDRGGYFKGGRYGELRKEVQLVLKEMGFVPEYDHHECAYSQHEIDYQYLDALKMADTILLLKYITKRTARKYELFASFMPKPIMKVNGSGMHTNQSLFRNGKNLFFDNKSNISNTARYYIGGLLYYIKEITSILNQYVNSYKRLVPGYEAPCYITWAFRNRSDLIRIPNAQNKNAVRVELRSPDAACNPYLAFALMLKAGMQGIEKKIEPPKPEQANVYNLTSKEREKRGIDRLPASLEQALKLTETSRFVKDVFGSHLFDKFIENKKLHLLEYEKSFNNKKDKTKPAISNYEIEKLLPIL